ncbi:MAG: TetR/AcrR family transcriptional regulator [Desulfatirhabdiaceae bacterium]
MSESVTLHIEKKNLSRCSGYRDLFVEKPSSTEWNLTDNRDRILMAAASLFANRGYAATSVREIVAAAGVTKPTLYYYFKNKEDLYLQLLDMAVLTFNDICRESLEVSGSMRIRLISLFSRVFELFQEYGDMVKLVNAMVWGSRESTPVYDLKSGHAYVESIFIQILADGVKEGELSSDHLQDVLVILMGVLHSLQVIPVIKPDGIVLSERFVEGIVHTIFDGPK